MYKYHLLLYFFVVLFILPGSFQPAFAYLDPGTGSYIFQIAIASLMGLLFSVKMFWNNIKMFFNARFSKKDTTAINNDVTPVNNDQNK